MIERRRQDMPSLRNDPIHNPLCCFCLNCKIKSYYGDRARIYKANRLQGDQVACDIFPRYWTRRIGVGFLAWQMQLVINRQERRSPRFSRVADLVARRECGVSSMPGDRLGGSNRGTRRIVSAAGLMRQTSVNAVS